jgi:hypothetical protein
MVFDGGNCTVVPDSTQTDAGVAGAGVCSPNPALTLAKIETDST